MIFKCPICGYPNSINSKFKCEACGNAIEEMYFYNTDSYLKELEYEIKRIEEFEEDELDDWDKAYLRLDEERPNEFYVKIIEGNPDDFEELDLNGFSYSMINSFICYI